jgi:hypothetical protein
LGSRALKGQPPSEPDQYSASQRWTYRPNTSWPIPLPVVSFHVPQLASFGLIVQTRTGRVRGATEHFYRLAIRARVVAERV